MINIVKQMSVQLGMMKYLKETLRHEAAVGSWRARSRGESSFVMAFHRRLDKHQEKVSIVPSWHCVLVD